MNSREQIIQALVQAIATVKNMTFTDSQLQDETYLGGNLGIDSIEMLEIWFEVCGMLQVFIDDAEKRDIYTVGDLVAVITPHLLSAKVA